ncbi:MAG: hypothetical protein K5837_05545 [Candidatus Saccharibacteria bacterium]|nr:hypothetical protein [Candidatus Saccharibacteria bacterium]
MEVIPNYLRCVISPFSIVNGGLAISNCRNSYVNNGSSYFKMPTDTYSSENYMLDDTSDLHYKNNYYTITLKDGTTIIVSLRMYTHPNF